MTRIGRLLLSLALLASFAGGLHLHRYLVRPIVSRPDGTFASAALPQYATMDAAALAAVARLYRCSHVYECASIIVQTPVGSFVNGPPTSDESGDSSRLMGGHPAGTTIVAAVHTHPCLPVTHTVGKFSPDDIGIAVRHHVVAYMLELCGGEVHKFVPGVDSPNDLEIEPDTGIYTASGTVIGKIAVDGLSVEPDTGF